MIITDYLQNFAEKTPKKTAIDDSNNTTYEELNQLVSNFSNYFHNMPKKSVISIMFDNSLEFVISYLGIVGVGNIAHLIPPKISKRNLEMQLKLSDSKMIITNQKIKKGLQQSEIGNRKLIEFSEVSSNLESSNNKPEMDDYSYVLFTSGTTAEPKGVGITHSQCEFTTKNIVNVLGYNQNDVNVVPLPFFHSFGLGCIHASIFSGSTLIIQNNTTNLKEILDIIYKKKATTFAAVPSTLSKISTEYKTEVEKNFSNVRLVITNSTTIPVSTVKEYKKILKNGYLTTYYGLTEASRSTFMIFKNDINKESSVGLPAPDVLVKIDENGEILIKGKNVIKKYWNNIEADQRINEGWLKTGDLGKIDSEGYLYLLGRNDDLINVAGNKVNPNEIETIVKRLPEIEEAIIIGKKHDTFGNVIKLLVKKIESSKIKKTEILSFCIKNMERYKVPIEIEFVSEFPRTEYGKIKRFMLQE